MTQDYLYFVSYARDDLYIKGSKGLEEEQYLAQFFADLREAVRSKAGRLQTDRVDFRDTQQIELGAEWRPVVVDGLQESRVLVGLYTPLFFGRPECGVEVGFMHRRRLSRYPGAAPHGFVIPVVWQPCESVPLPPIVKDLNYFYAELPPEYKQYGLRQLARQGNNFKAQYEQSVEAIAKQIDRVRQMDPLPKLAAPPDPRELAKAWMPASAGAATDRSKAKGAHVVHFGYVAATKLEVGTKTHQAPYEDRGEEWQPSASDGRMIGVVASGVAASNRFIPYPMALNETFKTQIEQAQRDTALVVLLVDAWSACVVQKYRDLMREYDTHSAAYCAVLVIWNEADPDIVPVRGDLEFILQHAVFQVNHSRPLPYFHQRIETLPDLETALGDTLERLRNEVVVRAEAARKLDALQFPSRPTVSNVPGSPAGR